jgi:hypothetical protein
MSDDPKRWIWYYESLSGRFKIDRLYQMAMDKEIDFTTWFWSEIDQSWKPLSGLMFDFEPDAFRIKQMSEAGITRVKVLGSGGEDCEACRALTNKVFAIESLPALPPENCRCVPWCRLIFVASE